MEIEVFRTIIKGDTVKTNFGGIATVNAKNMTQVQLCEWQQPESDVIAHKIFAHCSWFDMSEIVEVVKRLLDE